VAVLRMIADQLAAALKLAQAIGSLQRGREFTDQIINNLTAGLVVTDRRRVVQIVNARAAETLRIRPDELEGHDLLSIFPTAEPLFQYSYESVGRDCDLTLRDGTRIPLGYSNAFFADAVHGRDAVIITFRDLSEVRELQRKVRHAERLATIGTVAAGVAHEIRNPLFGISATAQLLARELPPESPLAELCRDMLDETRRLNDLVSSLVAYGRPHELKLRSIDPCALLHEAVLAVVARASEAGVTIEHACPPETAAGRRIEADPDQLKQVLLNLLINACDAGPGRPVQASVTWDPSGVWVTYAIRDGGPGIPQGDLDRIFDLFYTTKAKGSGLGLSLSGRIVQDHGGVVSASSPPGGGALFEVKLPIRRTLELEREGNLLHARADE
jgi:signal transduction histidine kinase